MKANLRVQTRQALRQRLLRWSGAELIVLSEKSQKALQAVLSNRVLQLKAAVDTERFVPVSEECKADLRRKYGIPQNKPVVLHIGHMKYGRNLDKLLAIDNRFHVVLVTSTATAAFADRELENKLAINLKTIENAVPATAPAAPNSGTNITVRSTLTAVDPNKIHVFP